MKKAKGKKQLLDSIVQINPNDKIDMYGIFAQLMSNSVKEAEKFQIKLIRGNKPDTSNKGRGV